MKNSSNIPVLDVAPGYELSTTSFAEENGMPEDLVSKELRQQLREHYANYGTRPFNLQYSPVSGNIVQVTSVVGLIRAQYFILNLIPKIPRLTLGKCLAMSQEVGTSVVSFDNREPIQAVISSKVSYSTIEALTFSFLDSIISVRNNGYARRFDEVFGPSIKTGANIEFQTSINQAQFMPPIVSELEATNDVFPNQILKAAYDRALRIALSIIKGNALEYAGYTEYLPAFTLDLDRLFEEFIAEITTRLLSQKKFEVAKHPHFEHDTVPWLQGDIIPDLHILHRQNENRVILDTKNKYSGLRELGKFTVPNPDLYQICYYCLNLGIKSAILVYPATSGAHQYPIRYSESENSHNLKVEKFLALSQELKRTMVATTPCKFDLYIYNIDLSGTMENTIRSVASLCLFIEHLLEKY